MAFLMSLQLVPVHQAPCLLPFESQYLPPHFADSGSQQVMEARASYKRSHNAPADYNVWEDQLHLSAPELLDHKVLIQWAHPLPSAVPRPNPQTRKGTSSSKMWCWATQLTANFQCPDRTASSMDKNMILMLERSLKSYLSFYCHQPVYPIEFATMLQIEWIPECKVPMDARKASSFAIPQPLHKPHTIIAQSYYPWF